MRRQDNQDIYEPQPKKPIVNPQKISTTRAPKKNSWSLRKRKGTLKNMRPKIAIELPEDFDELSRSPKRKKGHSK